MMDRFDGCYGGFAPLAGAIQETAQGAGTEHAFLFGVGDETEAKAREGNGIRFDGRWRLHLFYCFYCAMVEMAFWACMGQEARRWPGGGKGWSSGGSSLDLG
jgi:hypothetical protein